MGFLFGLALGLGVAVAVHYRRKAVIQGLKARIAGYLGYDENGN